MNKLDLLNKQQISELLNGLNSDTQALFGIMTPQHMVEHLTQTLEFSNGKFSSELLYNEEKAQKIKEYLLFVPENEIKPGFRAPFLPVGEVLSLVNNNLRTAIEKLEKELTDFHFYFENNPKVKPVNPTMGALTHDEWLIFHNKHFIHHFKQFGLL